MVELIEKGEGIAAVRGIGQLQLEDGAVSGGDIFGSSADIAPQGVADHVIFNRLALGGQRHCSRGAVKHLHAGGVIGQGVARRCIGTGGEYSGHSAGGRCRNQQARVADTAVDATGQAVFIHQCRNRQPGGGRAVVFKVQLTADFLRHCHHIGQMETADIERGVAGAAVFNHHAVVGAINGVLQGEVGFKADNRCGAVKPCIAGSEGHTDAAERGIGRDPGQAGDGHPVGANYRDAGDITKIVGPVHRMTIAVEQAVIVGRADFQARGKGADGGCAGFWRRGLGDDNGCTACREEPAKQDIAFVGRLTMGQVWHGVARVRVGDKTENHAFASLDPLAVGTDGGRPCALAGVDGVSLVGGYLVRVHAGNDQACGAATCLEHQKAVLPGGQAGEIKGQILAGCHPEVVGHVDHIVGVGGIRMHQLLLLHHPYLGPGCCLLKIGGEDDGAVRVGQIVVGGRCSTLTTGTAQHDIVVGVRVEKYFRAIEGIQAAPVRAAIGVARIAQRLALGIGKGQVYIGAGNGDQVGPGIAGSAGITAQRRIFDRGGAQQGEQPGLEREGQIAGIVGSIDGRDGYVVIVDIFDIGGGGGIL